VTRPLVFDRGYVSPCAGTYPAPGTCPRCGRELVSKGSQPRYCGKPCRDAIWQLPLQEREQRRAATPLGACVNCAATIPIAPYGCPRGTSLAWLKRWRAASGHLRFGPEGWEWLAAKLRLPVDDERLPVVALKLAEAGHLTVLVRNGTDVLGVAKPRRPAASGDAEQAP
jgi:hypothetical protein